MASAHLHASIGSRGKGHSAVAASAYRARAELVDERTGEQHDYTRHHSKCLWSGIFAPKDSPEWTCDSARLWNHVEAFEKHKKAELYREVEISLPHELTLKQNEYLLRDWIKENVTRKGLICEAFIHEAPRGGDERNIHAHVMIVTRKLDGSEFQRSKDKFDSYAAKQQHWAEALRAERASWEKHANRFLERYGHEARIDMGRKPDAEPTVHLGKHATALERLGVKTELGDINRAVEALNERRRAANENDAEAAPKIAEWLEDRAAEQLETLSRLAADEILEPEAGHQVADLDAALRARIRALEAQDPERFREIMGAYAPAHFAEWLREREEEPQARVPEASATSTAGTSPEAAQQPSPALGEAAPARPSYLPETVIPLPYQPVSTQQQEPTQEAALATPTVEPPRGVVEPVQERELPEVRFRPGLIFLGKCLEWGIAMASRIVDAIASIFENRAAREQPEPRRLAARPEPPQRETRPPPLPMPQRPAPVSRERAQDATPSPTPAAPQMEPTSRHSVADELRRMAREHREMTEPQREGVEQLRDVLRGPDNTRPRKHRR